MVRPSFEKTNGDTKSPLHIFITTSQKKDLDKMSKLNNCSKAQLVRQMIDQGINQCSLTGLSEDKILLTEKRIGRRLSSESESSESK